jgi:toxin-antitoxin system PIN domain toxin
VILPDVNLLIHAYNASSPVHPAAREWWANLLTEDRPVYLPWVVILGFIRISTNPKVSAHPLPVARACEIVETWLARPNVSVLHPGPKHGAILFDLLRSAGTAGNLTTDAHLAALAIEHEIDLCSTDSDFDFFPDLSWRNPLAQG